MHIVSSVAKQFTRFHWTHIPGRLIGIYQPEQTGRKPIPRANAPLSKSNDLFNLLYKSGKPIPENHYIGGAKKEELKELPQELQRAFSLEFANNKQVLSYNKKIARDRYKTFEQDTTTLPVKISQISLRMNNLESHVETHKADKKAKRVIRRDLIMYFRLLRELHIPVTDAIYRYRFDK
ncbi:hypothetical protein ROZALSC1DRAFT_28205 [Rozella allomycis CSF55]|uniref:Uncharacterized protein n=1 Tax=Rozella allomycis (strain CSF55) TaxID=988480 RepID=A0A4P9YLD1_ROZAC|nr:hypothetical protein ROZALSC1DRAFT_28205 [Rozella allomycis CSF55]